MEDNFTSSSTTDGSGRDLSIGRNRIKFFTCFSGVTFHSEAISRNVYAASPPIRSLAILVSDEAFKKLRATFPDVISAGMKGKNLES